MMYFPSRAEARKLANGRKVIDNGSDACKRWALKII